MHFVFDVGERPGVRLIFVSNYFASEHRFIVSTCCWYDAFEYCSLWTSRSLQSIGRETTSLSQSTVFIDFLLFKACSNGCRICSAVVHWHSYVVIPLPAFLVKQTRRAGSDPESMRPFVPVLFLYGHLSFIMLKIIGSLWSTLCQSLMSNITGKKL